VKVRRRALAAPGFLIGRLITDSGVRARGASYRVGPIPCRAVCGDMHVNTGLHVPPAGHTLLAHAAWCKFEINKYRTTYITYISNKLLVR